jgi:hypothetical protein
MWGPFTYLNLTIWDTKQVQTILKSPCRYPKFYLNRSKYNHNFLLFQISKFTIQNCHINVSIIFSRKVFRTFILLWKHCMRLQYEDTTARHTSVSEKLQLYTAWATRDHFVSCILLNSLKLSDSLYLNPSVFPQSVFVGFICFLENEPPSSGSKNTPSKKPA